SGEQVLGPSRDADVAGACDREAGRLLTVLRRFPELVAHNPEGRNLPRDPFRLRIQARDALARVRILHVSQPVPNHPADVQLVVQDAGAPFLVPVDRAWTPGSSKRSGDSLLIQAPGNRLWRDAGNVFPEDAFNNGGLRRLDLPLASRDSAAVQRFHHAVAVTETACRLPILDAPAQS